MTDYFGFTMAAMNDKGSIFANPQKGEKNPSTLLYRPFNSWTNNSEVLNTVVVQTTQNIPTAGFCECSRNCNTWVCKNNAILDCGKL